MNQKNTIYKVVVNHESSTRSVRRPENPLGWKMWGRATQGRVPSIHSKSLDGLRPLSLRQKMEEDERRRAEKAAVRPIRKD